MTLFLATLNNEKKLSSSIRYQFQLMNFQRFGWWGSQVGSGSPMAATVDAVGKCVMQKSNTEVQKGVPVNLREGASLLL